jgi:hypothetical protein
MAHLLRGTAARAILFDVVGRDDLLPSTSMRPGRLQAIVRLTCSYATYMPTIASVVIAGQ